MQSLQVHIASARGADRDLDAEIEKVLNGQSQNAPDYTASVDRCLDLLHAKLPNWHWHLGRDATGLMPYASISHDKLIASADGTTVPLVLLTAIIKALIEQNQK